jgi:hypothetical protein
MTWTAAGVQSGTDTSLAGITAVTGVTVNVTTLGVKVYNVPASVALLTITGDLSWNPDLECLVTSDATRVEQNNGTTVTIGVESVVNGKTRFSRGTGLIMNRQQTVATANTSAANWWIKDDAEFITFGGQIKTGGGFFVGSSTTPPRLGKVTINGRTEFFNLHDTQIMQVFRSFSAAVGMNINSAVLTGLKHGFIPFSTLGFNNLSAEMDFASFQADGNGARDPVTVPNAILAENKATRDFTYVAAANSLNNVNKYIFVNPDVGSAMRTAGQSPTTWRIGCAEIFRNVAFSVQDGNNNPAQDVVAYMALGSASLNPVGRYAGIDDYITPRKYVATTDNTGSTSALQVLYAVAQGYATDSTGAGDPLTMDSLTNRPDDVHVASIGGYSYLSAQVNVPMRGTQTNNVSWTVFDDANVTLSRTDALALIGTKYAIDPVAKTVTVLANADYDEMYDATKAYKYDGTAANFETPTANALILTPSGLDLNAFNGWELIVNSGVTLSEGDKFKKVKFTTVTINGTGQITAVYESNDGLSTAWRFSNVEAGSSIAVWNSSGVTKLYQQVTVDGDYTLYIPPGVTGVYQFAIEKYGFAREFGEFPANAGGLLFYVPKYIDDVGLSELDLATVLAYTDINTGSKFYDRTAAFRLTEQGIKLGQIATRSGFAIELGEGFGVLVDQNASNVYSLSGGLITIKALSFEGDTRYNTIIAVPPATVEADTNEVITIAVEDANGDSSVDILGGDGTFELWKVPTSTATNDYETGELLATVSNGRFRFIGIDGFDIVGVDINSNIRRRSSMAKGIYSQAFFVGDQIQLAQAPQVLENSVKLDILKVDLEAIKGQGFGTNQHSLVKLRQHVTNASQF